MHIARKISADTTLVRVAIDLKNKPNCETVTMPTKANAASPARDTALCSTAE